MLYNNVKINLILLASGYGRRFKGNKLLAKIQGKFIYKHVIDKVENMNFNKIICVTQYKEIEENLKVENPNVQVIINENSDLGISNSIKLGINYDKEADAYMFMVCDQPFIKRETIKEIVNKFCETNKGIIAVSKDGVIGNPVLFSKKYIDELLSLKGDTGGKKVLKRHIDDVELVEAQDKIELIDIDTQETYKNLKYNTFI